MEPLKRLAFYASDGSVISKSVMVVSLASTISISPYIVVSDTEPLWDLGADQLIVVNGAIAQKASFPAPNKASATANGSDAITFSSLPTGTSVLAFSNNPDFPMIRGTVNDGVAAFTSRFKGSMQVTLEHPLRVRTEVQIAFV